MSQEATELGIRRNSIVTSYYILIKFYLYIYLWHANILEWSFQRISHFRNAEEIQFLTHPSYFPIELTVTWRGLVTLLESHNERQAQLCDI